MTPRQQAARRAALRALIRTVNLEWYEVGNKKVGVNTVRNDNGGWRCTCEWFANATAACPSAPLRERACSHLMLVNDLIVRSMFQEKRQ